MSKKCAKCEKTVYPAEELKCLDKSWHKACFRCTECNMALTLSNHKGYNKMPYCNAHYPTSKPTSVTSTPHMETIKKAGEQTSQALYHQQHNSRFRGSVSGQGDAGYGGQGGYEEDQGYSAAPAPPMGGGGGRAAPSGGLVYTALYDYEAADNDEVGFQENDRIIDCEVVDDGWVVGTVERTGDRGMIPANYVERA